MQLKDSNGLPITVDEGESLPLSGYLKDPSGTTFVKTEIQSLTATLLNANDNSVINSRNQQSILDTNNGILNDDGLLELNLTAADHPIVDSTNTSEERILIIEWTYLDESAAVQTGTLKYEYSVLNKEESDESVIKAATEALDTTGIKRVKTKHIEVEAFDPRVVQEARDKENAIRPTFCSSNFCIGVPRANRRFNSEN